MVTARLNLGSTLKRLAQVPREAMSIMETAIEADAKGFVRDIVGLTPPSMGKANKESHNRGKMAITADLLGLSAGRSKHTRTAGVFVIMDDNLLAQQAALNPNGATVRLFAKKDGTVYGCDRHFFRPNASTSEMYAYHQSLRRKNGRVTRAGGATRDIGRFSFIQQMVVSRSAYLRYEKWIHKRVGILAAGFNKAAQKLKVNLPKWIKDHGTEDSLIIVKKTPGAFSITITNAVSFGSQADLPRRMQFVLDSVKRKKRIVFRVNAEIRAVLRRKSLAA